MPLNTPFPLIPPELLAQMAARAFRPPGPMSMSGAGPTPQRPPGFNVGAMGDAASGLMGLAAWKPSGNAGMPEDEKLGASVAGINAIPTNPDGSIPQPPMPTDIGYGQGGGGFLDWLFRRS